MISNISYAATSCIIEEILGSSLLNKTSNHVERALVIRRVVQIALESIDALQNGYLSQFDANACDQACHIRAIRTAVIAQQLLAQPTLLAETKVQLTQLRGRVDTLLNRLPSMQQETKNLPMQVLCKQANLTLNIAKEICYLAQAKLLVDSREVVSIEEPCSCHGSTKRVKEVTKPELLAHVNDVPPSTAEKNHQKKKLISLFSEVVTENKQRISQSSCEFLIDGVNNTLQEVLKVGTISVKKRTEVPCLAAGQALLEISKSNSIPIVVRVRKASHPFEGPDDPYDTSAQLTTEEPLPKQSLIVIDGQRFGVDESQDTYMHRLKQASLEQLILLNFAQHAAYSDPKVQLPESQLLQPLKEQIQALTEEAKTVGACYTNQSLFAITHIYASTMKELNK